LSDLSEKNHSRQDKSHAGPLASDTARQATPLKNVEIDTLNPWATFSMLLIEAPRRHLTITTLSIHDSFSIVGRDLF